MNEQFDQALERLRRCGRITSSERTVEYHLFLDHNYSLVISINGELDTHPEGGPVWDDRVRFGLSSERDEVTALVEAEKDDDKAVELFDLWIAHALSTVDHEHAAWLNKALRVADAEGQADHLGYIEMTKDLVANIPDTIYQTITSKTIYSVGEELDGYSVEGNWSEVWKPGEDVIHECHIRIDTQEGTHQYTYDGQGQEIKITGKSEPGEPVTHPLPGKLRRSDTIRFTELLDSVNEQISAQAA